VTNFQHVDSYTNPVCLIDGAVGASDATLTVQANPPGVNVSGDPFPIYVVAPDGTGGELMLVTPPLTGTGNKTWPITRGYGTGNPNPFGVTHASGDYVYLVTTAEMLEALADWNNLSNKPSTFAPTTHGNSVHTTTGTPGNSAVGDSAAQGSSASVARLDHVHGRESFAIPGPSAVGDSAAAGSASTVAHSDHVHGREAFATPTDLGNANAAGSAATVPHADHVHKRTVRVKKAGTDIGTRNAVNLIEGANVTLTVADNSGSDQVDVTIAAGAGSTTLAADTDVAITSPTDGDLLRYDATAAKWKNQNPRTAGHYETLVTGSPPVAVTNPGDTDWLIGWVAP
jgi:hypothetical protein